MYLKTFEVNFVALIKLKVQNEYVIFDFFT